MGTKRGYVTTSKYTELTNRTISNVVEWERQANRAEEIVDRMVGPYPPFNSAFMLSGFTATSSTLSGNNFRSDKDDYYNEMRVRVKQGTSKGDEVRIVEYDGATKTATVSGSFSSTPDETSIIVVDQDGIFPRLSDFDADSRPTIPDFVTQATAYTVEYWDVKSGSEGFNADVMNDTGGKESESIEDYSVSYDWSRDIREIIGRKAYEVLLRSGSIRRVGVIL